ncbi:MBL fold hydrolase [Maritimibacter sp. 55A14]|uniref:MBL fold metallo-hydrolase n=1 Tax=Maritimibacter sp. 55A14 TaxID=2174844 RepID=UPI000D61FCB2|nr:MBL fold metallo-hydrolase [Maritimibacter sp. 55A14]PWE32313.1 MBL fold hydrolase [Maritimibacter sp. 55A14]
MDGGLNPIRYPVEAPPAEGAAVELAEGVLWMRLPLPMALDHVNVYALREDDGWTVIDTGFASRRSREIWGRIMAGPLEGRPVTRVIATHHHPDHIGLAGWMQSEFGAELWTTRTAWLFARMLMLDEQDRPAQETLAFWRSAGMDAEIYAQRAAERPFNFADIVAPMPLGFRRIRQGDSVTMGGRVWDVHIGNGHAPEHATFWCRDAPLVIAGDQIIASISPNLGVYATEPEADPVAEWLEACTRLSALAREDHLVLPGHKLPFTGLPVRMRQLIDNHHGALARLLDHLDRPRSAADCFAPLFKREIRAGEYGLALVESVAHLNHLLQTGQAVRERGADGAWLWRRKEG